MSFSPSPLLPQAFAGFYYAFHFLNLTNQQSLTHVNTTIRAFCNKTWQEVRAPYRAARSPVPALSQSSAQKAHALLFPGPGRVSEHLFHSSLHHGP